MQQLGTYVRSKVPVGINPFSRSSGHPETLFLIPNMKSNSGDSGSSQYSRMDEDGDDSTRSYQNSPHQKHQERGSDEFDPDPKASNNKITAWQASYNITNAIQVSWIANFVFVAYFSLRFILC